MAFKYCNTNCNDPSAIPCERVGGPDATSVRLRVPQYNPARGVSVGIYGGDNCTSPTFGTFGKGLTLDLQCTDKGGLISNSIDIIPDASGCFYNALFASDVACPLGACVRGRMPRSAPPPRGHSSGVLPGCQLRDFSLAPHKQLSHPSTAKSPPILPPPLQSAPW